MPLPAQPQWTRSELTGATVELVWLLSIEWGGRIYRWSSQPLDVTDSAGQLARFPGGMDDLSFADEMETFSTEPEEQSVALEVVFPVDVAELIEQGYSLNDATGELSLVVVGGSYEDRVIMVAGRVVAPEYGEVDEPVRFTLEQHPYDDRATFPPPGAAVNATTYSTLLSEEDGRVYPFVFGRPGKYVDASGADADAPATPALIVDFSSGAGNKHAADTILLAGHRTRGTQATVYYEQDAGTAGTDGLSAYSSFTASITFGTDGLGRVTATADVSGKSLEERKGWPYWAVWDLTSAGGVRNPYEDDADLTGAGDLIRYMLDRSTLPVDYGAWAAVRGRLNQYRLAGYIVEPVAPWQWLAENVMPLLPVTVRSGPNGLYPVVWRWDAGPMDAVAHVEVAPGVEREGLVEYLQEPHELATEVRIAWAYDGLRDKHARETFFVAEPDSDDPEQVASLYARAAVARYGTGRVLAVESEILYDVATVNHIAAWMLLAHGFAHRRVSYSVPQWYGWLTPGDVVTISDSTLHWANRIALVDSVERTDGRRVMLGLWVVEKPDRDTATA